MAKEFSRWLRRVSFNLGRTCRTDNGMSVMDFGKTYVAGAMRAFKDTLIENDTHLLGVCLKPGAFSDFYSYAPQNELADKTVQLERRYSFDIDKILKNPVLYLNSFFSERLQSKNHLLHGVIDDIHRTCGCLSISEIAKRNCLSLRQLERNFRIHIGITPKEYSNIVRFQKALNMVKNAGSKRSFSEIAFECGFYDHAHFTNEIRRHTGLTPSQL